MHPQHYLDKQAFELQLPDEMRALAVTLESAVSEKRPKPQAVVAAVHELSWALATFVANDRNAKQFSHPGICFLIGNCISNHGALSQMRLIPPRCSKLQYVLRLVYLQQWRRVVAADPDCSRYQ